MTCCFKSNGDLYFTDPPYGLPLREKDRRRQLGHFGVYRRVVEAGLEPVEGSQAGSEGGIRRCAQPQLTLLTKEMARPNGLAFSPDEKTLYVAQSDPEGRDLDGLPRQGRRNPRQQATSSSTPPSTSASSPASPTA